jgi:hypothetical protein
MRTFKINLQYKSFDEKYRIIHFLIKCRKRGGSHLRWRCVSYVPLISTKVDKNNESNGKQFRKKPFKVKNVNSIWALDKSWTKKKVTLRALLPQWLMDRVCMWRPLWSSGSALVPIFILFACNSYQKKKDITFIQLSDCEYISVYRCQEVKFVTYVSRTASFSPHTTSTDQARWGFYNSTISQYKSHAQKKSVTKPKERLFHQSDVWRKGGMSWVWFPTRAERHFFVTSLRQCCPLGDTVGSGA